MNSPCHNFLSCTCFSCYQYCCIGGSDSFDEFNDLQHFRAFGNDPFELKNVADDPSYASDLRDLKHRMVEWMAKTEDHLYNEWIVYWLTGDVQLAAKAPGRTGTPW